MEILIGLGGNLGRVRESFIGALSDLNEFTFIDLRSCSSLYRTAPIGPDQPDYLNAVALFRISCDPRKLLNICQGIERKFGRNRPAEEPWGARTLDLDLLLGRDLVCAGPYLRLPHPRLTGRAFVLIPSAEIAPEWKHPFLGTSLKRLKGEGEALSRQRVERLEDRQWAAYSARVMPGRH